MALVRALAAIRAGVLSRVQISPSVITTVGGAASLSLCRGFAEGTYLNKDDVTERVLKVVKNFEKVDPAKASPY